MLGQWFEAAKARIEARRRQSGAGEPLTDSSGRSDLGFRARLAARVSATLRYLYRDTFGQLPDVSAYHPLWADTHAIVEAVRSWQRDGKSVLWVSSSDSLFHRWMTNRIDTAGIMTTLLPPGAAPGSRYDACLCELTTEEFARLRELYARIRPLMAERADVLVSVLNRQNDYLRAEDARLCEQAFPDTDVSELRVYGSWASAPTRQLFMWAVTSFANRPLLRDLASAVVLIAGAPIVRIAHMTPAGRGRTTFTRSWSSLLISLRIRRASPSAPALPPG
jgi:hypothetical protein